MIRTQIQLTPEQARQLKKMADRENKSVAEMIRISVDKMITTDGKSSDDSMRHKALKAFGKLHGAVNLAENHDDYLVEAFEQ
jgi:Spy/CpxP family protein refolding chaperone